MIFESFYFAYLEHIQSVAHVPKIVLDIYNDKSSTWYSKDRWFHISATDCQSQGSHSNYNNCRIVQSGWEAVPNMNSDLPYMVDTIEIKISFSKVDINISDTFGIVFYVTNTYDTWNSWPPGTNINSPSTWATAIFCNNLPSGIYQVNKQKNVMINYPNPFNPSTSIRFSIPKTEYVTLKVFDVLGNEISTLVNGEVPAGEHSVVFDAKDLPSGVYFYQLKTNSFTKVLKAGVLK